MDCVGLGEFKSLHAIFFSANEVCLYQGFRLQYIKTFGNRAECRTTY